MIYYKIYTIYYILYIIYNIFRAKKFTGSLSQLRNEQFAVQARQNLVDINVATIASPGVRAALDPAATIVETINWFRALWNLE